jgi:hypothetical protein
MALAMPKASPGREFPFALRHLRKVFALLRDNGEACVLQPRIWRLFR